LKKKRGGREFNKITKRACENEDPRWIIGLGVHALEPDGPLFIFAVKQRFILPPQDLFKLKRF